MATAKPSIGLMAPLDTGSPSWQAIRVISQRSGSAASRQAHFVIDSDGRSSSTECWKARKHLGQEGEIRIALLAPAQSNDVTPRQWSATQELVADLRQAYPITPGRVVVDDALALPRTARPARPRS